MPSDVFRFEASFFLFWAIIWPEFHLIKNFFNFYSIFMRSTLKVCIAKRGFVLNFHKNPTIFEGDIKEKLCTVVEKNFRNIFFDFLQFFFAKDMQKKFLRRKSETKISNLRPSSSLFGPLTVPDT